MRLDAFIAFIVNHNFVLIMKEWKNMEIIKKYIIGSTYLFKKVLSITFIFKSRLF